MKKSSRHILLGVVIFTLSFLPTLSGVLADSHGKSTKPKKSHVSNDWTQWRGPNHNGISGEKGWQDQFGPKGPKQLWKASIGTGFSSMSVGDGRVYTMGNIKDHDIVYCFDVETGDELWRHKYPCQLMAKYYKGGPSATPTIDGPWVYTFSKRGHLFCLDAKSGKVKWSKDIKKELGLMLPTWGFSGSPLIMGDLLILNAGSAGIALKKDTGNLVWKSGKTPGGYATPIPFLYNGKQCVAIFAELALEAVDVNTGEVVWKAPWKTSHNINSADPIFNGNAVFISSGYGKGCAMFQFDSGTPERIWKNSEMKNHFSSCVLWKGYLYGIDGQTGRSAPLKCIDFATGKVLWEQKGFKVGSLMLADEKLIILDGDGDLVIAKAQHQSYHEISRAPILKGKCWTPPVLAQKRLFARNAAGDLVCIDMRKP